MAIGTKTQEYVLGKGRLYFDPFDGAGNLTGEREIGDCPGFTISVESKKLDHYSSTSGVQENDATVTLSIDRKGEITVNNISDENLQLFVIGALATVTQSSGSVTDEARTVMKDRHYQLGVSTGNPTGVRGVSSVVVTDNAGTTTYVLGTDYELDATLGRIYIKPTGTITDGQTIKIDYTRAANSRKQISAASLTETRGALRFVADNPRGANRDLFMPSASLSPTGDAPFIGADKWMEFKLAVSAEKPATGSALYLDGRAV